MVDDDKLKDKQHLFRTRRATATRSELREEVVVLRWPRRSARRVPRAGRVTGHTRQGDG